MKRYVINHITELRNVGGFPVTTFTYDMGDRRTEVDINTAKGTEYVVGMGKGIVYRYDKNGVNAVFPINIAK